MAMVFCRACAKELHETAPTCMQCGAPQAASRQLAAESAGGVPDGVRGWCWGGFLLGWIWAIGNRSWWGLLALIPYVNIVVAIWLGLQGREMAWKNGKWDSVEHFNRVQRRWSQWGLGIAGIFMIGGFYIGFASALANHTARNDISMSAAAPALAVDAPAKTRTLVTADAI